MSLDFNTMTNLDVSSLNYSNIKVRTLTSSSHNIGSIKIKFTGVYTIDN